MTAEERNNGFWIQGTTDAATNVDVTFAGITKPAIVTGQRWEVYFGTTEIPLASDLVLQVTAVARDRAFNTSTMATLPVIVNTDPPAVPTINIIGNDNIVNSAEARSGIALNGTSQAGNLINIIIGTRSFSAIANRDGNWNIVIGSRSLPVADGEYIAKATATNKSGVISSSVIRTFQLDRTPPLILSAVLDGSTLVLETSEDLERGTFSPTEIDLMDRRTPIQIEMILISENAPRQLKIILTSQPEATADLSLNYMPNNNSNQILDMSGNLLSRFRSLKPSSIRTSSSVSVLAPGYTSIDLIGNSNIHAFGNRLNNIINGNIGDIIISGGYGADILTGGGGRNTFRLNSLSDSLLGSTTNPLYDHITDYSIGTDIIDAPVAIPKSKISHLGSINALNQANITSLLAPIQFQANSAATFTVSANATTRQFIAINDSTAGFNATRDAIIEIAGFAGSLLNLQIM